MKKESLSLITIRTLLAMVIFVGVGTIIIGGGYLIGDEARRIIKSEEAIKTKLLAIDDKKVDKEIDVFKFIPKDSIIIQKNIEDIDSDNAEEIILFFITDDEKFLPSVKRRFGKPNFMILKRDEINNNYKIYWQYNFDGKISYYITDKNSILTYDQKTNKPKIKFSIYKETSEMHLFVCANKENNTFGKIKISNDDIYLKRTSIEGVISIKDTDGDDIAEIIENSERGYIYKWDEKNNTYNVTNSCFKMNTKAHPANAQRRIYFDERYQYEIEYPVSIDVIECRDNIVRIGELQIYPPLTLEKDKIKNYECIEGIKRFTGHTPSQTIVSSCVKIQSNNKFEIFKKSSVNLHNAEEDIVYNLIKDNNNETFTLIQIHTGGRATTNLRFYLDDFVATFKFTESK